VAGAWLTGSYSLFLVFFEGNFDIAQDS